MGSAGDTEPPLQLQSKNVCVVGAGMAGMAAARELQREGHAVTVMEQSADVGGQWLYDPGTDGEDPLGATEPVRVPGSMYACLRLISPREAMGFSDFQFLPRHGVAGRDPRRYPVHREMYCYLREFCDAFGLLDAVRLNTRVLRVAPAMPTSSTRQWAVRSVHLGDRNEKEEVFDAVAVATGHYSQPKLPSIKGIAEWRRRQLHSHSYRTPEPFRGDVVVMVGCGDSGKDIALDLRRAAKEVYLTAKSTEEAMTPVMSKMLANHGNLHLRPQIDQLHADGRVVFADGSSVVADTVMYCTGYTYSFPFLETCGAVTIDDNRVGPLFEHVFPPSLAPSLSFIGIPRKVPIPWFFEAQGRWVAQVLSGRRALPPEEKMLRSVEEHYRARDAAGVPKRYTHDIGGVEPLKMYEFGEKYCDFRRIEDWQRELILSGIASMSQDMENFRDRTDDSENVRKGLQRWYGLAAPAQAQHDQTVSTKDHIHMAAAEVEVDFEVQAMAELLVN